MELVYEEVSEALLEPGTDAGILPNEIAGLDQKVEEIEAARPSLQFFIGPDRRLQRLLKAQATSGLGLVADHPFIPDLDRRASKKISG